MNTASKTACDGGLAEEDAMSEQGDALHEQIDESKKEKLDVKGKDEISIDNMAVETRRISLEPQEGEQDGSGRASLLENTKKDVIMENIEIDEKPDVAEKNSCADEIQPENADKREIEPEYEDEFIEPEPQESTKPQRVVVDEFDEPDVM